MLKTAGERSFKTASKNEKLLPGNDIEGILAVIDDWFKQRAVFYAKIAERYIKQKED